MGCAGHPDVKTPYLDTLASKGVRFENAYSACPSCVPARAALHTGLTQESHRRVGYADGIRWEYPHTMAGELTKAGYYTQCVGKMHVDPLRNYLGFCHVELHDGYLHYYRDPEIPYRENQKQADDYFHWLKQEKGIDCDVTDTGLECNSWVARPWIYEEKYHPTNWVTDRSIDFLRRRDPDMPFFLFTSYLRPHPPFDAPQCYFDMYRNKELTPPVVGDWCDEEALRARGRIFDSDTGPLDPELVQEMQIGYYACITHLDHQIGRLIQALVEISCMTIQLSFLSPTTASYWGIIICSARAVLIRVAAVCPSLFQAAASGRKTRQCEDGCSGASGCDANGAGGGRRTNPRQRGGNQPLEYGAEGKRNS